MNQSDERDPARGWLFVEGLIAEGQPEPERVPSAQEWVGPLAKGPALDTIAPPPRPTRGIHPLVWLAAAVILLLLGVVLTNTASVVALFKGAKP